MKITVFSKVLLVLIVHSCVASIIIRQPKPRHLTRIYKAGVDILMTCFADPHKTVGIIGDSDGSIVQAIRSKYFIPVALFDKTSEIYSVDTPVLHSLHVFIIASDSGDEFELSLIALMNTIWWNRDATFLILDTTPVVHKQCTHNGIYMHQTNVVFGLLSTLLICFHPQAGVVIFNANPYTRYAPKPWLFNFEFKIRYSHFYMFVQPYRKGRRKCKNLTFSKTIDLGGHPIYIFATDETVSLYAKTNDRIGNDTSLLTDMNSLLFSGHRWYMENIGIALHATPILGSTRPPNSLAIGLEPFSRFEVLGSGQRTDSYIFSPYQFPVFAITQHTRHKSQLEKILTVIDSKSRIGMGLVYLVTFFFFKFFLRQAVVPAILNLIRLTCNTGLTKLPTNVAPTIYLACLFAFVVTLQGIYTGNLASLLTTTISYRNLNTKEDIVKLGYKAYVPHHMYDGLAGDPTLAGHVIKLPQSDWYYEKCIEHVLSDPLAACLVTPDRAALMATSQNVHVSSESMFAMPLAYRISENTPLRHRLQALMTLWAENGLRREDERIRRYLQRFVDDDEVKKNTVRRVMNLNDLSFTFVILFVGLTCSLICFISELVIFRIGLKMAKRRNRVRARLAWEPTGKNCFTTLNFRFYARRLFSKRR